MATRGIELAREKGRTQIEMGSLQVRAHIYDQAGRLPDALADARAGLDALERLRLNLGPTDYLKSGFADDFQSLFAQTISLLHRSGKTAEAAGIAEQARSRAFLDLLASREAGGGADATAPLERLTMRGGAPTAGREPERMASAASAPVPTETTLREVASHLGSTLLEFWVGANETFVWAVTPDGQVRSHRAPVTRARLSRLVRQTWSLSDTQMTSRGLLVGEPPPEGSDVDNRPQASNSANSLKFLTMRGGEALASTGDELPAYRELYDLLIRPLRSALPRAPGSLLTIVPHGPLFELSFAALQDAQGRFLIEDFRLHYAPSAATLAFTARRVEDRRAARAYLFVANPALAPATGQTALPALPGAEREVHAVVRSLHGRSATSLVGPAATEAPCAARRPPPASCILRPTAWSRAIARSTRTWRWPPEGRATAG